MPLFLGKIYYISEGFHLQPEYKLIDADDSAAARLKLEDYAKAEVVECNKMEGLKRLELKAVAISKTL